MRNMLFMLAILVIYFLLPGCVHMTPPPEVVDAIKTVEEHVTVYVTEANWALAEVQHPDADLLIGTGDRIGRAVSAVSAWVQEVSRP